MIATQVPTENIAKRAYPVTTPLPTYTPLAQLPAEVMAHFDKTRELVMQKPQPGPHPEAEKEIVAGMTQLLNQAAKSSQALSQQSNLLQELQIDVALGPRRGEELATVIDVDGSGQPGLIFTPDFFGMAAYAYRRQGDTYNAYRLPPDIQPDQSIVLLEKVADLNNDKIPEIVINYRTSVGATNIFEYYFMRWNGKTFDTVLNTTLSTYAGSPSWEAKNDGGKATIVTSCQVMGIFDEKRLTHPTLQTIYTWQDNRYIQTSSDFKDVSTARSYVNIGETKMRRGQFKDALAAYQQAADRTNFQEDTLTQVDWQNLARFRQGQIYALLGDAKARNLMQQVLDKGLNLARLADAFLKNYQSPADGIKALVAVEKVPLQSQLQTDKGNDLGFPLKVSDLFYPGLPIAAFVRAQANGLEANPEAIKNSLKELGFQPSTVITDDFDGDGQKDMLVVLLATIPSTTSAVNRPTEAWLLTKGPDGIYAVRLSSDAQLNFKNIAPVPSTKLKAVVFESLPTPQAPTKVFGWDGHQVIHFRDTQTFSVMQADPASICNLH
ncbi:MAG: tetratricopeptide repeat protein [Chloroflexi bacterium]|nr:tetratricopeptide repeat protein [Chloroflexota bacterium]